MLTSHRPFDNRSELSLRTANMVVPGAFNGVALAAYVLIFALQEFVSWGARRPATIYCPVELAVFFPITLLIERIRRSTSIVCGTLVLMTVAVSAVWDWYG
jgi:hypothetical protein